MCKVLMFSSGYANLDNFVLPYVASIRKREPGADLTIVDNGTPEPYPEISGAKVARTANLAVMTSFNQAIPDEPWDWLMLTDTDVLCDAPFLSMVEKFDKACIYGQQMFNIGSLSWFDGWLFCIPRQVWDAIGKFDEAFLLTGAFQDMDYCIRANASGFGLRLAHLPFRHMEANTTHASPRFWENREYNRRLVELKHNIDMRDFA